MRIARGTDRASWSLFAVVLGGCNALLGLDPTTRGGATDAATDASATDGAIDGSVDVDAAADASLCTPLGHDEDGDGVDDACDNCPATPNTDQHDNDGDTVGDVCDPSLAPDDDIVGFDSFAVPSSWANTRGSWGRMTDTFDQFDLGADITLATRPLADPSAPELTVDINFSVTGTLPMRAMETPAIRGLGVWFVATSGSVTTEPNGYLCEITEDLSGPLGFLRTDLSEFKQPDVKFLASGTAPTTLADNATGSFRITRSALGDVRSCVFSMGNVTITLPGSSSTFTTGGLGLRTRNTAISIQSVTIYGKKP